MRIILSLSILLLLVSCATTQGTTGVNASADVAAKGMLDTIGELNRNSPKLVKAYISISGSLKGQIVKADGVAYLQQDPLKARLTFNDIIFKAPVLDIYADSRKMQIHYPTEKKLYEVYGNFDQSSMPLKSSNTQYLLAYTLTAKVPLLDNYSVKSYREEGEEQILVLENSIYSEEIIFSKEKPSKVTIKKIDGPTGYIIYYKNSFDQNGYTFYKTIRAYSPQTDEKLVVYYGKIIVDPSINKASVFSLQVPEGTEIIK